MSKSTVTEYADVMRLMPRVGFFLLCLSTLSFASLVSPIADLGPLPGTAFSAAYGINKSGLAVGESTNANYDDHAVVYHGRIASDLGVLPGMSYSDATGVNSAGQVVGYSGKLTRGSPGHNHAFLYSNGSMSDLGVLEGKDASEAKAIDSGGHVVGYSYIDTIGSYSAFDYSDGSMHALNMPQNVTDSLANGINSSGVIVGTFSGLEPKSRAFKYVKGLMIDLGTPSTASDSSAEAINDAGNIVGATGDGGDDHAFLYDGQTIINLGVPAGMQRSFALAINSYDEVVGYADRNNPPERATLFRDGTALDLNRLLPAHSGWVLEKATGINDMHQVVGYGQFNGQGRAFRLTLPESAVIPLPPAFWSATFAVALLSALGMLKRNWQRHH